MIDSTISTAVFYNKSEMIYEDYKWTAYPKGDPKVDGRPDSTLFNRNEGLEVLYFINKMAQIHSLTLKSDGKKMEMMIHNHLPIDMKSQENVKTWVMKNWKFH